jgi:alpha-glucoside transport system permease protein
MNRIILGLVVVIGVPAATVLYAFIIEWLLNRLPSAISRRLRPWLWVGPAFVLLTVYLIYPTLQTIYYSFRDANSTQFVGLTNFIYSFTNPAMRSSFQNNLIWLLLYPTFTLGIALIIAVLSDRVWYENVVKAVVFIPMAISFVAAGVIWKLMYDFQPVGQPQTGTLNALVMTLFPGALPRAWLTNYPINNVALIIIGIWMYAGFATVILSAGLKSIPVELLEASRIDGANEFQIFRNITLPLLSSTLAVVATTMVINVLKIFDVIYIMTNGNFNTDVIANRMYKELFTFHNLGRASAIATILLILTIPVMIINIRRFRAQEELR